MCVDKKADYDVKMKGVEVPVRLQPETPFGLCYSNWSAWEQN